MQNSDFSDKEVNFKQLAENANDGILIVLGDGSHAFANQRAAEITGYSIVEILGMNMLDLAHPDEFEMVSTRLQMRLEGISIPTRYEISIRSKNGQFVDVEVSAAKTTWYGNLASIIIIRDITEYKRVERALRTSIQTAQAILNATRDSALLIDAEGIIHDINEIAAEAVGCSKEQLIGESAYKYLPPSVAKSCKAYAQIVLRSKKPIEFEDERDGRIILNSMYPVFNGDGQVITIAIFGRDITEPRQTKLALQTSRDYLNSLMASVGDTIFTVQMPDRRIEFANKTAYDLFGYQPNEVIGQSTRIFYPDDESYKGFGSAVTKALDQGHSNIRMEQVLIRKNGERVWTEIHSTFWFSNNQLSQIISVIRDITERKQVELKLQESKDRYRRLVEESPDIVYSFSDIRGGCHYSARVQSILGYSPDYLLEHPMVWHDSIHPDDLEKVDRAINALKDGQQFDIEYRIQDMHGNWHWFRDRSIAQWQKGDETIIEGLASDITERKQADLKLRQYARQLEAMSEISVDLMTQLDLESVLHSIASHAVELLSGNGGGLYLYRPERDVLEWSMAVHPDAAPIGTILQRGEGLSGKVLEKGTLLIVEDYKHWEDRAAFFEGYPRTAIVAVPVRWGEEFLGVLNVLSDSPGAFSSDDAELLSLFANQAAIAIHNAQLLEVEQEQRRLAEALSEISQILTSTLDLDEVLEQILNKVERIVPHQGTNIHLLDDKSETVQIYQIKGYQNDHPGKPELGTTRHISEIPLYRQMVKDKKALVISDTHAEPSWALFPGTEWTRSYLGIPICRGERVFGFLNLDSAELDFFTKKHAHQLQVFANQAATALENARLFELVRTSRERLQSLSQRLVEMQESERRHVALELHDEIGQSLTGIRLMLDSVATQHIGAGAEAIQRAKTILDELLVKVRDLSLDLRPSMLDDLGLLPTFVWYIQRYKTQTNIEVDFRHANLDQRFQPAVEITAYRIVQEALTNIARHARTDRAEIAVWFDEDLETIHIRIKDRGAGFDPETVLANRTANGLVGMQERAVLLGGQLVIHSTPGDGTKLVASLPLGERIERRLYER
jgi:PAS domain S-box-containing protein